MQTPQFVVAMFKAFGDLVIAHRILANLGENDRSRVRLIVGSHLSGLASALPSSVAWTAVPVANDELPALFDIRRCGVTAAIGSLIDLRRAISRADRCDGEVLLFFCLGPRERLMARGWRACGLTMGHRNIYEAYLRFFEEQAMPVGLKPDVVPIRDGRRVGVFPGSRLASKIVPIEVAEHVCELIQRADLQPEIFNVAGDKEVSSAKFATTALPRRFESLVAALEGVDAVVSADSLPGHLGEYLAKPVFVISPRPNPYWLPYSCFSNGHFGFFGERAGLTASVRRFLEAIRAE